MGATFSAHTALLQRLAGLGFIEGRNLSIELEQIAISDTRLIDAAYADMVKRGADILLALGDERLLKGARLAAAERIPVVFAAMDYDPLKSGYIASLARPAGNLTGLFVRQPELAVKRLQIARDALPRARRVVLIWDGNVALDQFQASARAASSLGLDFQALEAGNVSYNLVDAVRQAVQMGAGAICLASSTPYYHLRAGMALAALEARVPLIAFARDFVEVGALLSYGVNVDGAWARAADYVARIADGMPPSDLPVEQPTRFELVVNGRTASTLGLTLSNALLGQADEVIE